MAGLFAINCLVTALLSLVFSVATALKRHQSPQPQLAWLWAFFSAAVAFWSLGLGMMTLSQSSAQANFWIRIHYFGAILIPTLYLHFTFILLRASNKKIVLFVCYGLTALFQYLSFSGDLVFAAAKPPFNFYTVPGRHYNIYTVFFFLCVLYAHILLFKTFRHTNGYQKYQIQYLFLGTGIGFIGGSTAFLPVYDVPIYPFGIPLVNVYVFIVSYAILRYRLMDLRFLFQETSRYFLSSSLVGLSFALAVILFSRDFGLASAIFLTSLVAPYLQNKLKEQIIEIKNRRGLIDNNVVSKVRTVGDRIKEAGYRISDLAETVTQIVVNECPVNGGSLMLVRDYDEEVFQVAGSVGLKNKYIEPLKLSDPIIKYLENQKRTLVKSEAERFFETEEFSKLKKSFDQLEAEIVAPLIVLDNVAGLLCIGPKIGNRPYFVNEIDRVDNIARETSTALRYVLAVSRAASETKRWAHSLNQSLKPLTQAYEFLDMGDTHELSPEERKEVFDVIKRTLKRLGGFLHYLTHQSRIIDEELRNNYEQLPVDIQEILSKSLKTHRLSFAAKNVGIMTKIDPLGKLQLEGHQRDLTGVFEAILSNAVRYVTDNGKIFINAEITNQVYRIEISNNGSIIPHENLEDIFVEGFQIKDGLEGTGGLGLANARRIISMHRGKIWAENMKDESGVKFIIELPISRKETKLEAA